MKILKETRLLLCIGGLMPSFHPKLWYKAVTIMSLINLIWISFFQVPYFFQSRDMVDFSDVLSLFSQYVMMFLRCIIFLYHNKKIRKFILKMEANVNINISMGRGARYVKADNSSNCLTKFYEICMSILTCGYMLYPLQVVLYQWWTGVEISWKLPIAVEFPWDISSHPNYEITYTAVWLNILHTLLYVLGLDTFFFCVIIHMSACFQDLRDMITETDAIVCSTDDGVCLVHRFGEVKRHLIKCIKLHNLALSFVQEMEEVISLVLFIAYFIIIFLICAVLFQASEHMMSSQITRDIMFVVSALIQLLVSTSFGSLITQESENVGFAVYSAQWYRQPPKLRLYYHLMLLRSQKPAYLTALTVFNSSLQSFAKVISGSTKAFALLQTMQENRK